VGLRAHVAFGYRTTQSRWHSLQVLHSTNSRKLGPTRRRAKQDDIRQRYITRPHGCRRTVRQSKGWAMLKQEGFISLLIPLKIKPLVFARHRKVLGKLVN
jgi:hypothetical protein